MTKPLADKEKSAGKLVCSFRPERRQTLPLVRTVAADHTAGTTWVIVRTNDNALLQGYSESGTLIANASLPASCGVTRMSVHADFVSLLEQDSDDLTHVTTYRIRPR